MIYCNKLWQSTFASHSWEVDISRLHYHVCFLPLCQLLLQLSPHTVLPQGFLRDISFPHTLTTRTNHFSHLLQYNYNIYNTQISSVYTKFNGPVFLLFFEWLTDFPLISRVRPRPQLISCRL